MPRGKYVVIEGNDGTGKSTQVELLKDYLKNQGIPTVTMHEPAGTPIADAIRTVIKNGELERDARTNLLLFTAARRENWIRVSDMLEQGTWVVSARNYLSTEVYQGYGEGIPVDEIHDITRRYTDERYMKPDYTIVLTVTDEERERRISERGELKSKDTFESRGREFQDSLNHGYATLARQYGYPTIDASCTVDEIQQEIRAIIFAAAE